MFLEKGTILPFSDTRGGQEAVKHLLKLVYMAFLSEQNYSFLSKPSFALLIGCVYRLITLPLVRFLTLAYTYIVGSIGF